MTSLLKRRNFFLLTAALIIIAAIFLLILHFLPKEIKQTDYQLYKTDFGPVYNSIEAKGVVEPESEVLLNSPANSMVNKIIHVPGSHVKAGQIIIVLDQTNIMEEIEQIEDQLEVKRNSLQKLMLQVKSQRLDLDYALETKKLRIASIKSELADQEQLLEVGGVSTAKLEKTKQELVSAEKDLNMTQEKNYIKLKQLRTEVKGLELQIQIEEKKLESRKKMLEKMNVRASSAGIILNITKKAGEKVKMDELLVRMSNLSSFKIIASIDEKQADLVKTGRQVFALIDDEILTGMVGTIKPVIENNNVNFDVYLDQQSHSKLIPNLKVDLRLVNEKRDSILRIKNGPAFTKSNRQIVYVADGERAYPKEISIGIIGDEYLEVKEGIEPGELVIISDISSFRRAKFIDLK